MVTLNILGVRRLMTKALLACQHTARNIADAPESLFATSDTG
jgi:hypothetical protein